MGSLFNIKQDIQHKFMLSLLRSQLIRCRKYMFSDFE
uniref:Uncharacterized protein n=1 Tax=Anguilla anguilla TaxID=7936 RepID=A0A0E9RUM7_ANGAN